MPLPLTRRRFFVAAGVSALGLAAAPRLGSTAPNPPRQPQGAPHPLANHEDATVLDGWFRFLYTQVQVERMSPPSSARAYAYCAVAAYEAVVGGMPDHVSLAGQLNGLGPLPPRQAPQRYHWSLVANASIEAVAMSAFANRSTASRQAIRAYAESVRLARAGGSSTTIRQRSNELGAAVGAALSAWMASDGYTEILGLPAYVPPTGPAMWERTPPNFGASLEPYWGRIRPFVLRPVSECAPLPPIEFSAVPGSAFHDQAMTVYNTSQALTQAQRDTATYWRDNPDGSTGLPAGHWTLVQLATISQLGLELGAAAAILAQTNIAVADAFTACWHGKFTHNLLRPVTYIRRYIDPAFSTFVNSPAFPEHTSGHSVSSAAAAETLTRLLGTVSITDNSGVPRGYPARTYASFWDAANEAAISRLYGAIHYPSGIEMGIEQGIRVAGVVAARVNVRHGSGAGQAG